MRETISLSLDSLLPLATWPPATQFWVSPDPFSTPESLSKISLLWPDGLLEKRPRHQPPPMPLASMTKKQLDAIRFVWTNIIFLPSDT